MTRDDIYLVIISLILVFSVLAGICLFVYLISVMIRGTAKKAESGSEVESNNIELPDTNKVVAIKTESDDPQIVAAIIAAISAYRARQYGQANANRFKVVSFRRTSGR